MKRWPTKELREVLSQRLEECRITDGSKETFVTVRLYGKGAIPRKIGDGKTPLMKTGYRLRSGDLIYSRIDARNGAFALVPKDLNGAVVSKDFPSFAILRDQVHPGFLSRFLSTEQFFAQLQASSFGTTNRQRITEELLLSYQIPAPHLAEQERIVKLLDEADELRKLRAQADRRTADLIPALFHEMFGDPDSNPKNWQLVKVKDVARLINGRAFKPSEWGKNGLPIIRIQNLRGPETVFNYYDGDFEPKHLVEKDALLVSWAGQLVSFGVHIWPGPKGVLNQHIFKIEPFVECELHFLQHALAHLVERAKLQFQGSEMKHLTNGAIDEGKIFFPPLPLQKEFAARVSDIRAMQAEQAASRRRLDDLFHSMLHRAFQGEL
jgi:type I restriction enzyme S subunit